MNLEPLGGMFKEPLMIIVVGIVALIGVYTWGLFDAGIDITSGLTFTSTAPSSATASSTGPNTNLGSHLADTYFPRDGNGFAMKVNNTLSNLYNQNVTAITLQMGKSSNSTRGLATVGVCDSSGTLTTTYGTANATTLGLTAADETFTHSAGHVMNVGDSVCVKYADTSASPATFTTAYNVTTATGGLFIYQGSPSKILTEYAKPASPAITNTFYNVSSGSTACNLYSGSNVICAENARAMQNTTTLQMSVTTSTANNTMFNGARNRIISEGTEVPTYFNFSTYSLTHVAYPTSVGVHVHGNTPNPDLIFGEFSAPGSALIGKTINSVSIPLQQVGNPTGNVTIGVWNNTGFLKYEICEIDVSLISKTEQELTCVNWASNYTIAQSNLIGAAFGGGDNSNFVNVFQTASGNDNPFDGANSQRKRWNGTLMISDSADVLERIGLASNTTAPGTTTLQGHIINYVSVKLQKTGSPTGTLTAGIWNNAGSLVYTIGSLDVSTVSTSASNYLLYNTVTNHTLAAGEHLGISYSGGGSYANYVTVFNNASNPFDGSNSEGAIWDGNYWERMNGADITLKVGLLHVDQAPSQLVGDTLNYVSLNLKKTGSPTGNATIGVFDGAGDLAYTISTIDVSTISTSQTDYLFNNTSSNRLIAGDDRIGIKYIGGGVSNYITAYSSNANPFDSSKSWQEVWNGTAWISTSSNDMRMLMGTYTPSTGADSALIGKTVNLISINMYRHGTPTGTVSVGIWDVNATFKKSFGTKDIRQMPADTVTDYSFYTSTPYTIVSGDRIGVTFTPTSGDVNNYLRVSATTNNTVFDGVATQMNSWTGSAWTTVTDDVRMTLTNVAYDPNSHYGLKMNGDADYVETNTMNILGTDTPQKLSVTAFVTPSIENESEIIVGDRYGSGKVGWSFELAKEPSTENHVYPQLQFYNTAGTLHTLRMTRALPFNTTSFVGVTYDGTGSTGVATFFLNGGSAKRTDSLSGSQTISIDNQHSFEVGARWATHSGNASENFKGTMDEVRVYNTTLSSSDMSTIYNGGNVSTGLTLYYKFNAGTGRYVIDYSGNSRNGVLVSNPAWVSSSVPNFVLVGTTNAETSLNGNKYDLSSKPWLYGANQTSYISGYAGDTSNLSPVTNTKFNYTLIDELHKRGVTGFVLNGVRSTFCTSSPSAAWCNNVGLPVINYARTQYGMYIWAMSYEDTAFMTMNDSQLVASADSLLTVAGPYFSGWTTDIEPDALSGYGGRNTTLTGIYESEWMHVHNVLGTEFHAHGKLFSAYKSPGQIDNIKSFTNYTHAIDDLYSTDYILLGDYKYDAASAIRTADNVMGNYTKPIMAWADTLLDTRGSATMSADEYNKFATAMDARHTSNATHLIAFGFFKSGIITSNDNPVSSILGKQQQLYKYTVGQNYNGTAWNNDAMVGLSGTVTLSNPPNYAASNALDANGATYWQDGGSESASDLVLDTGGPHTIKSITVTYPDANHMPTSASVYTSTNGVTWSQDSTFTPTTGAQTISFSQPLLGRYYKVTPSSWDDSPSVNSRISESTASIAAYTTSLQSADNARSGVFLAAQILPYGIILWGVGWAVTRYLGYT